jgi:MOSC domain-containing protein YiiM
MTLISVNVGQPRAVLWKGRTVTTGIFKEPVMSRVALRRYYLEGDAQADLAVHGGPHKAVYFYPAEHYAYWHRVFPNMQLPWGMFGENFTTEGLLEETVHIGDRFRLGSAEVQVTESRMPCYKLGLRFGRDDIIKRFLTSGRTGFYGAIVQEGEVGAGDAIVPIRRDAHQVTVADITRLFVRDKNDRKMLQRVVQLEALSDNWRGYFQQQIDKLAQ